MADRLDGMKCQSADLFCPWQAVKENSYVIWWGQLYMVGATILECTPVVKLPKYTYTRIH